MYVQFPVHANVGIAVCNVTNVNNPNRFLAIDPEPTPAPDTYRVPAKTWTHPGYVTDPRIMVASVARARGVINRTTASTVTQGVSVLTSTSSVPAYVARMASKWDLVAYNVKPCDIRAEIRTRGPVIAAVHVNSSLLARVNTSLLESYERKINPNPTPTPNPDPNLNVDEEEPDLGTIIVAVLGWDGPNWVVALPWGKFPSLGWDGTVHMPDVTLMNTCALARADAVNDTKMSELLYIEVGLLPPNWDAPTTQPLPPVENVGSVSGKYKSLRRRQRDKGKSKSKDVIQIVTKWMSNEDNMNLTMQCSVTMVVIIIGILTLFMMRSKSKQH